MGVTRLVGSCDILGSRFKELTEFCGIGVIDTSFGKFEIEAGINATEVFIREFL